MVDLNILNITLPKNKTGKYYKYSNRLQNVNMPLV